MGRKLSNTQRIEILNKFRVEFPTITFKFEAIRDYPTLAWADLSKSVIQINLDIKLTKAELISTLCHEVGHILLYRKGKFTTYHELATREEGLSLDEIRRFYAESKFVEKEADRIGIGLCNKHFPKIKYAFDPEDSMYDITNYLSLEYQRLNAEMQLIDSIRDMVKHECTEV